MILSEDWTFDGCLDSFFLSVFLVVLGISIWAESFGVSLLTVSDGMILSDSFVEQFLMVKIVITNIWAGIIGLLIYGILHTHKVNYDTVNRGNNGCFSSESQGKP